MFEALEEIKGIGGKVKEQLLTYYGGEEEALRSLEKEEFERLLEAGLPLPKAAEIARSVWSAKRGFSYATMLRTPEIREVFNRILEALRSYPRTGFGRVAVGLFYPTKDEAEVKRRLQYVRECADLAGRLEDKREEVDALLSQVAPLKGGSPGVEDTIAVEDRELYETLLQRLRGRAQVILIESPEDLEYLRDSEFIRYLQRNARFSDSALTLPQVEPVYEDDMESIVPEEALSFFGRNRGSIAASVRIARLSGDPETAADAKALSQDLEAIEGLDAGGSIKAPKEGPDLAFALENLEETAQRLLEDANREVSEKTAAMSFKGDELLGMLLSTGRGGGIQGLPGEFIELLHTTAAHCERRLAEALGIAEEWTRDLFSRDTYPLELDQERLAETGTSLTVEKRKRDFEAKKALAKRLAPHIPAAKRLVRKAMDLDLRLSLGRFYLDRGLTTPELQTRTGIGFKEGVNIHLKGRDIQPVSHVLGSCALFPEHSERAVVITGANSGGKTTLLELIAQTALMTHMGLGAPAKEAATTLFDEIYYFGKGQGTDAGAFESLLKSFEDLARSSKKRLILADEIEAITEPGAAAKILSAILDWFKEDENTIIAMVTHLGEDISEHTGAGIRIDGIEARGLDEDLNLIVNRNPVLGRLAKSTPELIVERLSRASPNKDFYKRILDRFSPPRKL